MSAVTYYLADGTPVAVDATLRGAGVAPVLDFTLRGGAIVPIYLENPLGPDAEEPAGCEVCGGPLCDDREQRRGTCWCCVVSDPDNYGNEE